MFWDTFTAIIQLIAIFILPVFIIRLKNTKFVSFIGTIGFAYLLGIAVALIRFLLGKANIQINLNSDIGQIGSYAAIAIAIPLLLFSSNLKATKQLSKQVARSFGLQMLSVVVVSTIAFFCFKNVLGTDTATYSGMATGLYTGGTPNLNSIGTVLGLDANKIAVSNLSDMLIGGVFYVFLLVGCKPLLSKILKHGNKDYLKQKVDVKNIDNIDNKVITAKPLLLNALIALGCAVLSAGCGILIWVLLGATQGKMMDYLTPSLLIGVTVFGIVLSFVKKIREVNGSNLLGHYFILVFSFALAMTLDLSQLNSSMLYIFLFFATITLGTFVIHTLLCFIFKIDSDCAMVTLTAGIYGPAFVPAITRQIGNDDLTAAGLICGSLGYAVGTFLGLGFAYLLMLL